ncbi:hypothetical protein GCM10022416_12370 [Actinomadura keratinilytica]|uniref:Uncharacterized protein n=1 Tax=Actinomadura keratinilytica TaxID=547461 RepID=A0ABP7Y9F3_9ACTN
MGRLRRVAHRDGLHRGGVPAGLAETDARTRGRPGDPHVARVGTLPRKLLGSRLEGRLRLRLWGLSIVSPRGPGTVSVQGGPSDGRTRMVTRTNCFHPRPTRGVLTGRHNARRKGRLRNKNATNAADEVFVNSPVTSPKRVQDLRFRDTPPNLVTLLTYAHNGVE